MSWKGRTPVTTRSSERSTPRQEGRRARPGSLGGEPGLRVQAAKEGKKETMEAITLEVTYLLEVIAGIVDRLLEEGKEVTW
jgi:hypothetical protein